ncbi:MAG TPA: hypothetical protein VEK57_29995 [Thermoanaerobaculia bacterium]|nr:hypothetical protein [Thermoanaerobaculia bacterium]
MRLLCILFVATLANAAEVTRAGMWELHSSFWMNLHQNLLHDVISKTPRDLGALTAEERTAWTEAVAACRTASGRSMAFARDILATQNELSQVADDAVAPSLSGPLAAAVRQAAPVYRKHWWQADDTANRFHLGYTAAMLRDAGDELARAHEAVYREKYPKSIRVDIAAYGGMFGAYSIWLDDPGFVVTMTSRDDGYQGLRALEMILHESSHSIVSPNNGTVANAIHSTAKRLGIPPPRDLWHAILFATTGQLTRRALAQRGVADFVPSSEDLLTRAWPEYRKPIETHWYPYLLSGTGTLEEAIGKIVEATREAGK